MNIIIYSTCFFILILFILRTETYRLRQYIKELDKEITKAFNTQKPTRYKPSKYLVISK